VAALPCQLGTTFTEPTVPNALQTRGRPIVGQGKSGGGLTPCGTRWTSRRRRSSGSPP